MVSNIKQSPLVSITCLTYNHAPYLRQCLDGFVMQKTSFPIEILIYDDASEDGTQDIIRECHLQTHHHKSKFLLEKIFSE